jgi:hypothetical protein
MGHIGRVLAHSTVILVVLLLALAAVTVITGSSDGWLTALLNGPVDLFVGKRAGIHFHTQRLHASWQSGCPVLVELNGAEAALQNEATDHLTVETVRLCGSEVALYNIVAGSEQHERLLTTRDVRANLFTHAAFAEKLAIADRAGRVLVEIDKAELANALLTASGMVALHNPDSGEPVARAGQIQTSSLHLPLQANGELNLARLSATNLQLRLNRAGQPLAELAALQQSGQELAGLAQQAVSSGGKLLGVIHDLALVALLAATAFLTILKWFASSGLHPPRARVLISFVPALVAWGLFFLFRNVSTAAGLVVAAAALGVIAGIVLWQILYRRSREWLSRWEPFALDAFAPAPLMLLLLLWAFELRLPARSIPGSILVSSVELRALNARLAANGFTSEAIIPEANVTALKLILQPGKLALDTATLDRFELNGGDARVQHEAGRELVRTQIQSFAAAGVSVGKEISTGRVRPFAVKDLKMHGGVESGILARHVREFQWLPAEWHGPQQFQLAVSGSLSRKEHLQFGASVELRSRVLDFDATASGDSDSIELTSLRTLKDSPLRIGAATGTITWATGLKTALTMRELGGPGFGVESGNLDASLHGPEFTLGSRWQGANVSFSGFRTSFDSSVFDLAFAEHKFSTAARLSGVTVTGAKNGAQNSWLEADFPSVEAQASGTRSGWKSLAGTASFRIADGAQSVLSADRALRFSVDPSKGAITVPEQTLELQQQMTDMIPRRLGLTLSLAGDPQSMSLQTRIPRLALPDVAPLQIEVDGLQLSSQWRRGNSSELRFSSGWNRLVLPATAGDWTLKDIAKARVETDGTATRALLKQLDALRQRASGFHFEPERWFRVEGSTEDGARLLLIQGRQGGGARISPVVDTRRLRIKRGRIAESAIHVQASGIRTLDGHGNLSTAVDWKAIGDSSNLAVHVPGNDGAGLLDATFQRHPGWLRFTLDKPLSLARFIPEVQPFLSQAGINLSEFEIGATVSQLDAQADLAGSDWTRLVAQVETAPGPLFRFSQNSSPANPLDVAVGSNARSRGLHVNLDGGDGTVRVTAEAPGLAVRSEGGTEHANIDADLTATLSHRPAPSPLFSKLRGTVAGVRAAMEGTPRAFPVNSEEKPPLAWKLKLSDDASEAPVLTVGRDRLKLRLHADPSFVSLGSTRLDFSSSVAADLSLQEDQLILDAFMRIGYDLRLKGRGMHQADVKLPVLIAIGDVLQPVNAPHGPLWDSQRYSAFWDRYRAAVNATIASNDPWQSTQVALGPVEIEELSVAPPLRATIQLSKDAVQVDLPLKGTFLYGDSVGTLQFQSRWAGDEAMLDSFLGWSFQNAQAEALRIATGFGYQPLVQDRMGLSLAASARGLALSRRVLEAALADPGKFNQFDKMALDLDVRSVPGSTGRLQLESDFDVKRMNNLMRQIASDIQLTFPPEVISWERARLRLLLKDGALENNAPVVALTGVEGVRNSLAQFSGSLRLFAGRGPKTPLQDVVHTLMLFR